MNERTAWADGLEVPHWPTTRTPNTSFGLAALALTMTNRRRSLGPWCGSQEAGISFAIIGKEETC